MRSNPTLPICAVARDRFGCSQSRMAVRCGAPGGAVRRCPRIAAIVIERRQYAPPLLLLAHDVSLTGLPLGVQGVERTSGSAIRIRSCQL
jgi:hypothetical protein